MRVELDNVAITQGKAVVYIKIFDDANSLIATYSTYFSTREAFRTELVARLGSIQRREEEKKAAVQTIVIDVISHVNLVLAGG